MERLYSYLKRNLNLTKSELAKTINDVLVNDEVVTLSKLINNTDIIKYKNQVLEDYKDLRYFIYNKPVGIETTNKVSEFSYLVNLNLDIRVFSIGRLDKDSHGLLLLTNDGLFHDSLVKPNNSVEKEYIVVTDKIIDKKFLKALEAGIDIGNYITKKAKTRYLDENTFSIIIIEGKNRQIRKMVKALNHNVVDLYRIRIGKYNIMNLQENEVLEVGKTNGISNL